MRFAKEPLLQPSFAGNTAILLCNLGTPDAPTPVALRRYLAEFLSDPRVVEIPKLLWWPILHGIILRLRPAKSAAKYASIWTTEGSPLRFWTEKQAKLLQGWLSQSEFPVEVRPAMRYGNPSIASQLDALKALGVSRVLVMSAYPQYSGTTSASVVDAVGAWSRKIRNVPELRFINDYHDDPGYIHALARSIKNYWRDQGRSELLVMSFHGIPQRSVALGDPYAQQCQRTAQLLAIELGLQAADYKITFQSRFGKAKWLQPYTEPTLVALAKSGVKQVDVVCPGFISDCLETLEEINQEARQAFLVAGGQEFNYIPCLNDSPEWITALRGLALQHLAGWPTRNQNAVASDGIGN